MALDEAVKAGAVPSKSALVEQALLRELKELHMQNRRDLWEQTARDPIFLKDIKDVEATFLSADAETAREIR